MSEKIILQLIKQKILTKEKIDKIKRQFSAKSKKTFATTAELLKAYRQLLAFNKIQSSPHLEKLLQKRSVRTLSGVAVVTVLTKPWPCPGQCVYCPSETDMPKSYLKNEPAAQRAYFNKFNPFNQVYTRLETLYHNGHPTDKIELIIKGGSWNAYPWNYQTRFVKECFRAANDFKIKNKNNEIIKQLNGKKMLDCFRQRRAPLSDGTIAQLLKEQTKNERAEGRIVGLTLETRPDLITPLRIWQMRLLGCTRVELGVQHTDNKILKLVKRGHTIEDVKKTLVLLRQAGFKIDFHLMPQLPGSTPKKDYQMIKKVFEDSDLRPDMIKIYPCAVVKDSELYRWYKQKKYKPYSNKKLVELLIKIKTKIIPSYCRISRLIRDIPSTEIMAGNRVTNLRQTIQKEMKKRNLKCQCLRCREVGHQEMKNNAQNMTRRKNLKPKLFVDKYEASGGIEYFLSFEDVRRQVVFAFCRLRLDSHGLFPAFIRELHTYGRLVPVGQQKKESFQHKGLGKKLIAEAEKITRKNKIPLIAVISGIGVRDYYRHLGYRLKNTYMVKKLKWKI